VTDPEDPSPDPMNELMVMPNVTIAFAAPTGGGK